ncbi:phosphate propanoyltransferase [Thaumasiovibrio sp. DFM-14]|uniref:phosphate propanoyltransferase n=1 Tax=Thaumasiovibrio sp. DFM-14 TaxID=3384792 RepID=UPI00399FE880
MNLTLTSFINEKVKHILKSRPVPIGISNRHIHISEQDFAVLFPGQSLQVHAPLSQTGQFASKQTLDLFGPKGVIKNVRILGPFRPQTQVEISLTNARELGVKAEIRQSGDLAGTPGITLCSEHGQVDISSGVIVSKRHIHMNEVDAMMFNLHDCQEVDVVVGSEDRKVTMNSVVVRVSDDSVLELHLDTDEANAAGVSGQSGFGEIIFAE